jgi:hypothetical protein
VLLRGTLEMYSPKPVAIGLGRTSALERDTLRAVSRRLIPFLFLLYVISFLDRVNIGFAALQMNRDLGLSPAVYGLGAGSRIMHRHTPILGKAAGNEAGRHLLLLLTTSR